ncbi:MAG: YdiU family protein [Neofamilia sp.]
MTKTNFNFDNSYENLPSRFFRKVHVNPVPHPGMVILNEDLANELDLQIGDDALDIFSGREFPKEASSISMAYLGHQFGNLAMLGDGRAILVGEHLTKDNKRFDIQLKGSGRTPFSRGGDGRAAIGPMLREYLISEAMYYLGIPTTRSLAVITTGEKVIREKILEGAILTRVAKSHLRVGTFQYANYQQDLEDFKKLADYAIARHYSEIINEDDKYIKFYEKVIQAQGSLIAKWQAVGFVHGVMNTDNVTISGETIDYGPCAFLDKYDPDAVFSSIDRYGRYAYGNQPQIGFWNLARFGEALLPLIHEDEKVALDLVNEALSKYSSIFQNYYYEEMTKKIGIESFKPEDISLVDELLIFLKENERDYTNFFLDLTFGNFESEAYKTGSFLTWKEKWEDRLKEENKSQNELLEYMKNHNPALIPRNYWVERALKLVEDEGDFSDFNRLLEALKEPFAHKNYQEFYRVVPDNMEYVTYCGT